MPRNYNSCFPHWEIVPYLATQVPGPYPVDAAHRYIRDLALPAAEHGEVWHRALGLKFNPAEILGSTDLHKKENDNRGSGVASGGSAKAL